MNCVYCGRQATDRIPALQSEVCREHAIEFWTGLMAYAKEARDHSEREEQEEPCHCWTCNQLSAPKAPSITADAVGPIRGNFGRSHAACTLSPAAKVSAIGQPPAPATAAVQN